MVSDVGSGGHLDSSLLCETDLTVIVGGYESSDKNVHICINPLLYLRLNLMVPAFAVRFWGRRVLALCGGGALERGSQ